MVRMVCVCVYIHCGFVVDNTSGSPLDDTGGLPTTGVEGGPHRPLYPSPPSVRRPGPREHERPGVSEGTSRVEGRQGTNPLLVTLTTHAGYHHGRDWPGGLQHKVPLWPGVPKGP